MSIDPVSFKYIAAGMTVFGMLGAAMSIGQIFSTALNAISRNPSSEEKMSTYIYVGAGLAEAMGLFSLVLGLLLIL